jgi:antitoxin Phd
MSPKPRRPGKRPLPPFVPPATTGASEVREASEDRVARTSDSVRATDAKNQFGRLLDRALSGQRVVITKHEAPAAVLMSFEEYRRLVPEAAPDLDALSQEFDELLARMQSAPARRATRALFAASPSALAKAAVGGARGAARRRKRG